MSPMNVEAKTLNKILAGIEIIYQDQVEFTPGLPGWFNI